MIGLISDKVQNILLNLLEKEGYRFDYLPDIAHEELIKIIKNYGFIIVRGRTRVDKEVVDKAEKLKAIIRFGVGLDNIDVAYAEKKGIMIFNTPRAFTEAVAELTIAHILGILRNLGEAHFSLRNMKWEKKKFYGYELKNKTIAILGFGRIGRRVADLLQPYNVRIIAYDIIPIPKEYLEKGVITAEDIENAVSEADIITIHMPLTPATQGLIDKKLIEKMIKKPFIINTARGRIINFSDLKEALKNGRIKGVALDVYPSEPFNDNELISMPNVLLTPHIGAQTYEANEKAAYEIIEILKNTSSL